ncbi:LPXTG cell wall anchor domain-containing protein [Streptococcus parasanguinis]|uniref:SIALI-17 repeat-containing surface protein n=1 Tax=Streptococcus parasanguinis TaxID=1318 RepID=UPI0012BD7F04|nr:SIALI-17 repeat-containing surface protein [Streptococcus parasanguinis]MTS09278.1 LPXTG cell wall anchor domain-containing protein [Streptococcus parasanguinis]
MNKKLVLATVATITAVATAQGVYADEVQGTTGTGNEASAVTTAETGRTGTEKNESTQADKQPTAETTNAEAGSESNDNNQSGNATQFSKDGDNIQVTNPNVVVDQSKGTGKYQGFTVEYKNVHFPDDMAINEGDKVKFTLPEEVKFQTNFDFDVYNPEKQVVGKATTDTATNTVTTVFNNYFKDHPLNKQMSLKLDATWTDKVESGKPVTANFNGTLVTAQIGAEQVIGKDELISKWGSQDEKDPTIINWTARVNYAKRVLNYVTIIDEMSENQKLVDDYFEIKNIESVDPWIDKGSAMDLVKSISKSEHGFTIKMDRLDRMIYVNYKTKLTNAVKDSVNPTNKIELKAESDGAVSYSYVQLVGGRGDASGENKPIWEIPNDAPKYEKPSIDLKDIPLMPPAPIVDIPEWKGGTTPWDAPQYDKPEWNGGTVPFDAPVLDKPEINIEDIPMMPPAPVLEKPELIIDLPKPNTPTVTIDKPSIPVEINSKPSKTTVEPQKEQVNVIYQPTKTNAHTLPNTGTESSLVLSFAGMFILGGMARIALKHEGE